MRWLERMPVTEALEYVPDAQLIAAVRAGDVSAFGELYQRHLVSAKRAAACLAKTPAEREDLVAEAFTRVLRMLREGRGPDEDFRPYLLVTLRNTAIHTSTRGAQVSLYADVPDAYLTEAWDDPVINRWHEMVAADAFASLPERWQVVLWHTEVENESPANVAPLLGMRPNSVAALAYRAREGLRQAYLNMHLPDSPRRECRPTVDKLAGWVRHSIPQPLSRKINRHLDTCSDCRERADTLAKVNNEMGGMVAPVVLSAPLAAVVADAGTVSGLLTAKAAAVQVAAAVAVTATAITATSSAPADATTHAGTTVVREVHAPATGQAAATVGVTTGARATAPTIVPIPAATTARAATSSPATGKASGKAQGKSQEKRTKTKKAKKDKGASSADKAEKKADKEKAKKEKENRGKKGKKNAE